MIAFVHHNAESIAAVFPDRRRNHLHAAFVEAAIRLATEGKLDRAPAFLASKGVGYKVTVRVLHPQGERRQRTGHWFQLQGDCLQGGPKLVIVD